MQYKLLCTNSEGLPRENGGIWLWQETIGGRPKVPSGSPVPLVPRKMRNFDEVAKGLGGFVNLWNTMVNEDISGEFKRRNEPLSYYWKAVTSAMDAAISVLQTLHGRPKPRHGSLSCVIDHLGRGDFLLASVLCVLISIIILVIEV
jgi:hypothetical protein